MKLFFQVGFVFMLLLTVFYHWTENPNWLIYAFFTILYRIELIKGEQE